MPRFVLDDAMKLIDKAKPTVMPGVPTMFIAMLNHPKLTSFDLSSLQVLRLGRRAAAGRGQGEVREADGLQGRGGLRPVRGLAQRHLQSRGRAREERAPSASRCRARSFRCATLPIPPKRCRQGEKGEICVKGPQVMKGYWKRPEETANQFVGDFLRTGDVGIMDADGFIFIVDRIKDLIICSGYNVYPRRIEEAIYEHPAVEEVTVIGIKDRVSRRGPQGLHQAQGGHDGDRGRHPQAPGEPSSPRSRCRRRSSSATRCPRP